MCQHLPVGKGKIGCGTHGTQVSLSLLAIHRSTNQFPIRERYSITANCSLELLDIVCANLVPEAARTAVDLHNKAAIMETKNAARLCIEYFIHDIDFNEMVS